MLDLKRMRLPCTLVVILTTNLLVGWSFADEGSANPKSEKSTRVTRQTNADQMVQNILKWLQGVYTQQSRRSRLADYQDIFNFASDKLDDAFRQGTLREYLPPTNTQKPRPFETARPPGENGIDYNNDYIQGGYPPAGSITPQPPFTIYTNPGAPPQTGGYPQTTFPGQGTPPRPTGYPTGPTGTTGGYPTPGFPTHAAEPSTPGGFTGYPSGQPTPNTEAPGTQPPISTVASTERPGFPTRPPPAAVTGYPSELPGFPTQFPSGSTTTQPGFPTQPPSGISTGYPTQSPSEYPTQTTSGYPTRPPPGMFTGYPTQQPEVTDTPATSGRPILSTEPSIVETDAPTSGPPTSPTQTETFTSATTEEQSPATGGTTQSPEINTIPTEGPEKPPGDTAPVENDTDDDLQHPPHIHALEVECAKDMMKINIEFNRQFDGIIYSKGYYNMPECRYVQENSAQTKYTFTVNLNQCGTEFINAFDTQGQSYLENILVLQNEAGIQEVWDTVRAVRCLWEGNLKETLSVALSVGMLSQELVTFSGDTAVAKLDILLGRGPLGQPANGLVKIGEPMTLVVSVSGDPGFDIQVKDCRATDSTGENTIPLSDDNGCVLKPKLFGAFQKTRNTGDSGAAIIAYAYFNAFKFPDVMDLMIECNIELCKTDCGMCTDPNQKLEPGRRRRRDIYSYNETLHDGVTMGKRLRIILPEDLSDRTVLDLVNHEGVCMSTHSFVFSSALLISLLTASCLFSAYMWLKTQQLKLIKK
ncbi:hypothetical protein NQ315_009182 [Exocentrus adspersus]|uniref:ZP domain-containing protein n=1 Tax=Exocentrus adspersus TaxID=1586481 RepID=A0AAV8WFI7_9CUCU|nr:hypothetical protein NQ315_009182 [Exocentrus adspersus]